MEVVQAPPHAQVSQADQRESHPVAAEVEGAEVEGEVGLPLNSQSKLINDQLAKRLGKYKQ